MAHAAHGIGAHAEIVSINADASARHPGVKRICIGEDAARAGLAPAIHLEDSPVPASNNVLGAKGVGKSGCTASMPSVANALMDALRPLGVNRRLDMPMTPARVWRATRAARKGSEW